VPCTRPVGERSSVTHAINRPITNGYETRDASGLSLMMRLKTSLPRALAVTFFVLT